MRGGERGCDCDGEGVVIGSFGDSFTDDCRQHQSNH